MNFKQKIAVTLGTSAAIAQLFMGAAFAATDVNVIGNGYRSDVDVKISNTQSSSINQSNAQFVGTHIELDNNTGKNNANANTGADVTQITGDIHNNVQVKVTGGTNIAHVDACGCQPGDTEVNVKHNGAKADVDVKIYNRLSSTIDQSNRSKVYTGIDIDNNTGKNDANYNTGKHSDITQYTGNISDKVKVYVGGSANILH